MAKVSDFKFEYPSIAKTESLIPVKAEPAPVKHKPKPQVTSVDLVKQDQAQKGSGVESLTKSVLNLLNGGPDSISRLSFTVDPTINHSYAGIYIPKLRLMPDFLLKRIAIQDDLVASIVQVRMNQMAAFGVPRRDRFGVGFVIEPNTGLVETMSDADKKTLDERIAAAVKKIDTCGDTTGWSDSNKCSFANWVRASTRNGVVVGRLATEIIWVNDTNTQSKRFHSFRPIDAGTIYRATPQKSALQSVRDAAFAKLQEIAGTDKKLIKEKYEKGQYAWVQVIENQPQEVFAEDECVVHNFYPVPDVEMQGYPVTPIDTMIAAITTHINITTQNKLYFQNGRASHGMIVIESEEVDQNLLDTIRQQFNASINNVNNSFRMPVFGIATGESLTWQSIDSTSRDMEFQYLMDMNARVILTAFQMSPDELPGWSYLSRGTNSQSLAESNNEFKQEAIRDLGIRPLISHFEDFLNSTIFPLIDPVLAKISRIRFMGLEADNAEKEAIRLQQDMPIHMSMNQVYTKVEKALISHEMGGDFPLNPSFQSTVLDKLFTIGEQLEYFCGRKGAAQDPDLAYIPNQFWFQMQALKQAAQQAQQAAMQPPPAPGGGDSGGDGGGDDSALQQGANQQPGGQAADGKPDVQGGNAEGGADNGPTAPGAPDSAQKQTADLSRSIDMALDLLTKSENSLPQGKRKLLAQQRMTIDNFLKGFQTDINQATKEILDTVDKHSKKN